MNSLCFALYNYNYTCPVLTWWTVWSVQGTCLTSAFRALHSDNTTGPMFTHDIFHPHSLPEVSLSFFYPLSLSLSPPLSILHVFGFLCLASIHRKELGRRVDDFPTRSRALALIVPINWDIVCIMQRNNMVIVHVYDLIKLFAAWCCKSTGVQVD